MPKSQNQKLKLLLLKDYLLENTDENHSVTVQDMIDMLAEHEIKAERKSIYDDLKSLGMDGYGLDIDHQGHTYRVLSREFELQEVKILVDMVQSSNFITKNKTARLISKLETLTSRYEAQKLQRQVYVRNRVKVMSESIYQLVDKISEAINTNRRIRFQYCTYNVRKERVLRHEGKTHQVSPLALIWVDQNYYLLAWNPEREGLTHFRVDRMVTLTILDKPREGLKEFAAVDMSTYTTKVFSMFSGEPRQVRLRFTNNLTDPVLDRFGMDIILVPDGEDHFTVTVDVVVSTQFYAWLTPYGTQAEILYPPDVRQGFVDHLKEITALYE